MIHSPLTHGFAKRAKPSVLVEPGGSGAVRLHARALGPWFSGMQDSHALRRAGLLDGDAALLDRLVGAPGVPRLADSF
ncbi:sterol carrier protein domain-containing protein [Actinosynnema sp. NPDC023658]|uniref:sterol carrier protein domain-containing protein n=1 Tax=Actinosynnema sp. NPDC023658 TaxID=3155465 RepID=UPI0033D285D3